MPSYKLHYFDLRGRGESIRHLFLLAGQPFEDVHYGENWPQHKEEMPLGQVPVLEIDNYKLAQTMTIHRYLGNAFGLAGSTPLEKAKLDMIGEVVQDLWAEEGPLWFGRVLLGMRPDISTKEQKDAFFKDKVRPAIDKFAPLIEKFLLENGNNGLFMGDKETWVDLFAAESFVRFVDFGEKDCLDAYPHIKDLIARVHAIPAIRKHIEERHDMII